MAEAQRISASVDERHQQLRAAREMVVEDPGILSGTPVIKGTRVPVYDVAAVFDAGTPMDRILDSYPSLKEWQVELASVYASAVPQVARPKRPAYPAGTKISVTRKRLHSTIE